MIPGVEIGEIVAHADERGWMAELSRSTDYIQDNLFFSKQAVLRGLHIQPIHPQGKLFIPITGEIYQAVVDCRPFSPTFGRWYGSIIRVGSYMITPPGCLTGTLALVDSMVFYRTTEYFYPGESITIAWNDPALGIEWPIPCPRLKQEDENGKSFKEVFGG